MRPLIARTYSEAVTALAARLAKHEAPCHISGSCADRVNPGCMKNLNDGCQGMLGISGTRPPGTSAHRSGGAGW
jgi:hypothetical protein